jgi:mono/diheme cytochrome c family protein
MQIGGICGTGRAAVFVRGCSCTLMLLSAATIARAADDDSAAAKAAYKAKCVVCHSADGSGSNATGKALKVPDLRAEAVQKLSDAELGRIIADGKDNMPSFKGSTSDAEIRGLVAYIRELAPKKAAK